MDASTPPDLHVLVVGDHLGHSGAKRHGGTTYFLSVLPALRRAGVRLTVCFQGRRHPAADELAAEGVEPMFLNRGKWDARTALDLVRIARWSNPNIVHLHTWKSDLIGRLVARPLGLPAIVHVHDTAKPTFLIGAAQRALTPWTAAMVTVSEAVREFATREYSIPPEKVHLLHHGIDLRAFSKEPAEARFAIRREFSIPPKARVVAVIGRLVEQKGQSELIRAMEGVFRKPERDDVRLLIVGEGPTRAACEKLAAELCPPGRVIFTGQRLDIPAILSAADIVAMPTLSEEGFGYAALEAIAAGRPVAAFRSGGIPAMVVDGKTGLLVEKGNAALLGRAIALLLDDDALRAELGENARHHSQRFSLERHVDRMIDIYRSVLPTSLPQPRIVRSANGVRQKHRSTRVINSDREAVGTRAGPAA